MMEEAKRITYFSQHQVPFPQVQNAKTNTRDFLNASKSVVGLMELLGKGFAPARYDMNGNIEKITKKYDEDRESYMYLEDMLLAEKQRGELFATESLMWLRRGLHFLLEFFETIVYDDSHKEDLSGAIKLAYANTLKRYHGWIGSNLFGLLSKLVPYRRVLFEYIALGNKNCDDLVVEEMESFTRNLRPCIAHLIAFYKDNNLESDKKV